MPLYPSDPDIAGLYAEYKFYTTDLVSNELLAEIPFKDVSYDRTLKDAGRFSGKIEVIQTPEVSVFSNRNPEGQQGVPSYSTEHLDLYNSTMPGKTGLYVMRNGVCVWGGIIWTRKYDIVSRQLDVSASEFTSYLHHRIAWKTFKQDYEAIVVSTNGACEVRLIDFAEVEGNGLSTIVPGASIKLTFYEVGNFQYNGFRTILSAVQPEPGAQWTTANYLTCNVPGLPSKTYTKVTVSVRTDTYNYVRSLLDSTFVDFINLPFANDEIEPARGVDSRITALSLVDNIVTVTTATPHEAVLGQTGLMFNVDPTNPIFEGQFIVSDIPDENTLQYEYEAPNNTSVDTSVILRNVVSKNITNYIATLTTSQPHQFQLGETVVIEGVDDDVSSSQILDGTFVVAGIPDGNPNKFQYITAGVYNIAEKTVTGGTATVTPTVTLGSYGSYPFNSDLLIEYDTESDSDIEYSGENAESVTLRGFELRTIGEVLNQYSDVVNGFEYRIDCSYDYENSLFRRKFVFLPILLPGAPPENGWRPVTDFPKAEQNVFEYPGNIDEFSMEESAEDVATRFFVLGNIPDLGDGVSQPYAVAAAIDLLAPEQFIDPESKNYQTSWPLLDVVEERNDIYEEDELYQHAQRYLKESRPPITKMTVSINGSLSPQVGEFNPGEWCSIIVDDVFFRERVRGPLEPDRDFLIRKIESIKVSVPNMPTFPEKVTLDLIPEWEVDERG